MQENELMVDLLALYTTANRIKIPDGYLTELINKSTTEGQQSLLRQHPNWKDKLTVSDIICHYSQVFTKEEQVSNGIYYTPYELTNVITAYLVDNMDNPKTVIDPAMGAGAFLVDMADKMSTKFALPVTTIVEDYIFGIDIMSDNVDMTTCLLDLLCLEREGVLPKKSNLLNHDSLDLSEELLLSELGRSTFDVVVANPPYVTASNINPEVRTKLSKFTQSTFGKSDLYIPFFEIGMSLLEEGGTGAYLTPNTFLSSQNGKNLREFLSDNSSEIKLINFDGDKVFDKVQHYLAITIFRKEIKADKVDHVYLPTNKLGQMSDDNVWEPLLIKGTWHTTSQKDQDLIYKLENTFTTKLGELQFQYGIGTQRNGIYSFEFSREDENYYYFTKDSKEYKVERELTRPFVLPNKRKQGDPLRIIFPYYFDTTSGSVLPVDEHTMSTKYPCGLAYLEDYKEELDSRNSDKHMKYWYLYGRGQGLSQYGSRLYLPTIAKKVQTMLSKEDNEVFTSGYAIFHESEEYLIKLSKFIESDFFAYYVSKVSKPYSSGYYGTSKTLIKNFSIPSEEELASIPVNLLTEEYMREMYEI